MACIASGALMLEKFGVCVSSPRSSCRLLRPHASRSIHCFWMHILSNFGNRVHQRYHEDTAHCAFQSLCGCATALWPCMTNLCTDAHTTHVHLSYAHRHPRNAVLLLLQNRVH